MRHHIINRDIKRRQLYKKYELIRNLLKSIIYNRNLKPIIRYNAFLKLNSLPKDSSIVRIRNRCVLTGRSRAVYKLFKISRTIFRKLASNGYIQGVQKSSW